MLAVCQGGKEARLFLSRRREAVNIIQPVPLPAYISARPRPALSSALAPSGLSALQMVPATKALMSWLSAVSWQSLFAEG